MNKIKEFIEKHKVVLAFMAGIILTSLFVWKLDRWQYGYNIGYLRALNNMKVKIDLGTGVVTMPDSEYDKIYGDE